MAKKIGLGVLVVLALVLGVVATRPAHFRVARGIVIAAPPAAVYEQVADFHRWPAWSPWEKLDPAMKRTFSGPGSGPGAVYAWTGNDKVGEGRMTVTSAIPPREVIIRLEFIKPFASSATTAMQLTPQAAGTGIEWTMEGDNDFLAKAFGLFMDMDKLIGGDFERGLAQLKAVAEAAPPPAAVPAAATSPASASAGTAR